MRSLSLKLAGVLALGWACATSAASAVLHTPASVPAGQAFTMQTEGSGEATFYLLGPSGASKQTIQLGRDIHIDSEKVSSAGQYKAILCSGQDCAHAAFEVRAGAPSRLSFFLHPSRVPVSVPDAIDATAFLFDRYYNPVLAPAKVEFQIAPSSAAGFSRVVSSQRGVAWMRMGSTGKEGAVRITAAIGDVIVPRVIQQVAAEACGLRIKGIRDKNGVTLETDPVRDCSGNPLPDGTIVSFTSIDSAGKTAVDTPIKKGVARAQLAVKGRGRISVACGVVLGNELSITGST
ncbi:MAG: hypothetical protein WB952_01625 [Terriglobales bacterium]